MSDTSVDPNTSSVFQRFLAVLGQASDVALAHNLGELAKTVYPDDYESELDDAKTLLNCARGWMRVALERCDSSISMPDLPIRSGDDAFQIWQALDGPVGQLEDRSACDQALLDCLREGLRALEIGMDIGPFPAGGMAPMKDPLGAPAIIRESRPPHPRLLDLAEAVGRTLQCYGDARLGGVIDAARSAVSARG